MVQESHHRDTVLTHRRFHILCNHSRAVSKFCNKLDYLGILILMWGAGIATIFYGFSCDQELRLTYGAAVRVCLSPKRVQELRLFQTSFSALLCMLLTLGPHFDSSRFRHWRAVFYAAFGLSSVTFVIHGIVLYGWEMQKSRMSLVWMGWMAVINLSGATIYAARVAYPMILFLAVD